MPPDTAAARHLELATAEDTRRFGRRLGGVLQAGDLVVLAGDLGAGKTTLTQGIGEALGVRGPVTSPTFVIARVHPPLAGPGRGVPLVHVDAYRLGGVAELDDLDLDASLEEAVTVVEWGHGIAEGLGDHWLELTLTRTVADDDPEGDPEGEPGGGTRTVRLTAYGERWTDPAAAAALEQLVSGLD